ncbi:hypothetical protein EDB19DRAFT_1894205 [Suillus lakei]|nr:hypothetical protein EDB19DRAFT_1894205 [Suillus lakei]
MDTSQIQNLACSLIVAGCSQGCVRALIQEFFLLFGVRGGVAAKLQLAHEIGQTKNLTISSDGTSHHHVNFESMHINLTVPDYAASGISHDTPSSKNQTHLLTVGSTANHMSETQLELWKTKINSLCDLYDRSPLSHNNPWTEEWKVENLYQALGKAFLDDHASDNTVISLCTDAHLSKITSAGGQDIWDQLPVGEKFSCNALTDDTMEHAVGKEVFKILSDEKKWEYLWFVCAGCAMHKEMNTMKADNVTLMACWLKNDLTPPILLVNKDNAAVLQCIDPMADGLSAAEECAMKVSTCRGVKAVSLAGDIFNHKDDKKGQQDPHWVIMEKLKGFISMFPDTSNTCFQSHCLGCIELIVWWPQYIVLLEIIRDKKEKCNFNHMELNLYNALHDVSTLTEMSVIILYHEAISIWYLDFSQLTDLNILDLGPCHDQLKAHIQKLIDDPDLLLCPDTTGETATLTGKSWHNLDAIKAVHELMASPEYEADSLITMSTAEECAMAYMPTMNDANEGTLAMHQYEAQALFHCNNTQDFTDSTIFTGAIEKFCMQEARQIDGQKLEKKRWRELAEHDEQEVEETHQRVAVKKVKMAEKDALLDAVDSFLMTQNLMPST